jgi:RHS repeat-associated protein
MKSSLLQQVVHLELESTFLSTNDAPAGGFPPVGTTTVTWSATDAAGNTGTATQTVTVTYAPPVATETIYWHHNDHLGTPQALTDINGTVVWTMNQMPFGIATVNEDPDGDGIRMTNNFRFPGQYYDSETGLNYNYQRTYDPALGRYTQSDPIGLNGGMNPFGYVGGNPVSHTDLLGLRCDGTGCWTTPQERQILNRGNYLGYYQAACSGGDKYACFAQHVANNDNWKGNLANGWLDFALDKHAEESKQCIDKEGIKERIRKGLANAYADYLPQSQDQAAWPTVNGVKQFHWNTFAKYGLPPWAFGGSPFGGDAWFAHDIINWCPNCR